MVVPCCHMRVLIGGIQNKEEWALFTENLPKVVKNKEKLGKNKKESRIKGAKV